jgi:hypothetical protein
MGCLAHFRGRTDVGARKKQQDRPPVMGKAVYAGQRRAIRYYPPDFYAADLIIRISLLIFLK